MVCLGMGEDPQVEAEPSLGISRRKFLRWGAAGAAAAGLAVAGIRLRQNKDDVEPTSTPSLESIVAKVESMPLSELERLMYVETPVIPDMEKFGDELDRFGIAKDSSVWLTGSSVALGMGESIQVGVDESFSDVMSYFNFHLPVGDIVDANIAYGADIPAFFSPSFCQNETYCGPNDSLAEGFVNYYHPKISINFFGTNMVRNKVTLKEFADNFDELVRFYKDRGVFPILTTFPEPPNAKEEPYRSWFESPSAIVRPGENEAEKVREEIEYRSSMRPENALKYNALIIEIARMHEIPVINLQRGVVESAKYNGTVTALDRNDNDIDPEHFSSYREPRPLAIPQDGEKFEKGEQAVSYFVLEALSGVLKHLPQ